MNERFFTLPPERQRQMVNAGYKIFAEYPYKKAPMSAIAEAAGISKPLLFHYFGNKKGLYLFLFDLALKTADEQSDAEGLKDETDFFLYLTKIFQKEIRLMSQYPSLTRFLRTVYFETDPEVLTDITKRKSGYLGGSTTDLLTRVDRSCFQDSKAPEVLLELITLASEGFMTFHTPLMYQDSDIVMTKVQQILDSLRHHYYTEETIKNDNNT